jgi:hypothetical protein
MWANLILPSAVFPVLFIFFVFLLPSSFFLLVLLFWQRVRGGYMGTPLISWPPVHQLNG